MVQHSFKLGSPVVFYRINYNSPGRQFSIHKSTTVKCTILPNHLHTRLELGSGWVSSGPGSSMHTRLLFIIKGFQSPVTLWLKALFLARSKPLTPCVSLIKLAFAYLSPSYWLISESRPKCAKLSRISQQTRSMLTSHTGIITEAYLYVLFAVIIIA